MEPEEAAAVLRRAAQLACTAAVIVYEPTRPADAFGATMMSHLEVCKLWDAVCVRSSYMSPHGVWGA